MLKTLMRRIRAKLDQFVRTHIVADEKELWPELDTLELHELDRAA